MPKIFLFVKFLACSGSNPPSADLVGREGFGALPFGQSRPLVPLNRCSLFSRIQRNSLRIPYILQYPMPTWQARRDSNPQRAALETAALPVGATGLCRPLSKPYFSSLCSVLFLQNLQNFFISSLPVCFFLFLVLV